MTVSKKITDIEISTLKQFIGNIEYSRTNFMIHETSDCVDYLIIDERSQKYFSSKNNYYLFYHYSFQIISVY